MQRIEATWPLGNKVLAFTTTRLDGFSQGNYQGLNTGFHVGDDAALVNKNRAAVLSQMSITDVQWLEQVHGTLAIEAQRSGETVEADACWTDQTNLACAVMTADCLPVVFSQSDKVAVAHAGWRGLLNGILENTLQPFEPSQTSIWLGPAIGSQVFQVGGEVREQYLGKSMSFASAFTQDNGIDKWLADIYLLARLTLEQQGIPSANIYGGEYCTFTDQQRFYSYRRQPVTGRMATLVCRLD